MQSRGRSVVVPGNHDGVHLGHRALLQHARARAIAVGGNTRVVAYTFDPHPAEFLRPGSAPQRLTTIERRIELLREAGADEVVVAKFDEKMAARAPAEFVDDVLVGELSACAVIVGEDFRFGARREGDIGKLRAFGRERGFDVETAKAVEVNGVRASSSRVREALVEGDVVLARTLLGRPHDFDGRVIHGDRRGRTLGFPTANLSEPRCMLPADGIYAVSVELLSSPHDKHDDLRARPLVGAASIGARPTFGATRSLEVFILDFEADLYDAVLRIACVERIRGVMKFDSAEELVTAMHRDVARTREIFSNIAQ